MVQQQQQQRQLKMMMAILYGHLTKTFNRCHHDLFYCCSETDIDNPTQKNKNSEFWYLCEERSKQPPPEALQCESLIIGT